MHFLKPSIIYLTCNDRCRSFFAFTVKKSWKQRQIERVIRKQKRRILIDESTGDKDKLQTDQIRLVRYREEYKRFSDAAGLPTQHERAEVAGFTWKHGKAAEKYAVSVGQRDTKQKNTPAKDTSSALSLKPTQTKLSENKKVQPGYVDITGKWYPDAVPNSNPVKHLHEVVVDGVVYKVDGRNVQLNYTHHEKEIAELLLREVGGEIFMVPRVNNPQGVSTPDYIFNGKAYDLKTLSKEATENTIFNRVKKARKQANNFIIDVSNTALRSDVIDAQIEKLFNNKSTVFVDEIVIIRSGAIVKVVKRK